MLPRQPDLPGPAGTSPERNRLPLSWAPLLWLLHRQPGPFPYLRTGRAMRLSLDSRRRLAVRRQRPRGRALRRQRNSHGSLPADPAPNSPLLQWGPTLALGGRSVRPAQRRRGSGANFREPRAPEQRRAPPPLLAQTLLVPTPAQTALHATRPG